ncbi:GNAT family N-acetyltransferase [Ichthyenterobacterium sp. W332]|uniref:GNAT family N-acetyltransferase n=1 Tax=Microcosmobacter mediterraneus TaxID=3075607 RepID=A0ABU2YM85_9FLAO|nr:GNAT family N-acetyltransferase [Ichthyenterobacterium sp. W332]MDT0559246.1 GNAT family N-acetyltransferase [Ichthyenterobacterium sp. W332]
MDYHSDLFSDHSLLIYKDKTLLGLLPANLKDGKLYSHQGLTYGGLILTVTIKFKYVLECFKTLLQYLENEGIKELVVKQIPSIYCSHPSAELDYIFYKLNAELYRKDILSVIATTTEDIKFSKDRLDGVKRGVKNNLIVKEEYTFDDFWNVILIPNLDRKHKTKPVHSLDEIKLLKQRFPNNIRQFNVYKDNELVAGTTIFETKNVAHSQYISGNSKKNMLGSLDFLHNHLLCNVFNRKAFFDFGISHDNDGKVNEGLLYWKEGFGARSITQDFYEIDTTNHTLLNSVFS